MHRNLCSCSHHRANYGTLLECYSVVLSLDIIVLLEHSVLTWINRDNGTNILKLQVGTLQVFQLRVLVSTYEGYVCITQQHAYKQAYKCVNIPSCCKCGVQHDQKRVSLLSGSGAPKFGFEEHLVT